MFLPFGRNKDVYAGLVMIFLGLFAAYVASGYGVGTTQDVGPGFIPLWLGIALTGVGFLILLQSLRSPIEDSMAAEPLPDTRASLCIVGGLLAFIIGAKHVGLIPASLALIFISALGDREQSWKGAVILAAGLTLFGAVVFSYLLGLPLPLLRWSF